MVERAVINLYNTSVKQGENIERQAESIGRQAASIDEQGKQIEKFLEAQKDTNERLNAVIFMAEKYFSGEIDNPKSKKK